MGVQATPPASRLCCSLPLQKQQGRLSDRPVPENASACCPGLGPSAGASGTSHRAGLQTPQGPVQPAGFRRFPPRRCHPLRPRGGDKGQAVPQRAPLSSSGPTELRRLGRAPFWPGTLRHLVRRHFRGPSCPHKAWSSEPWPRPRLLLLHPPPGDFPASVLRTQPVPHKVGQGLGPKLCWRSPLPASSLLLEGGPVGWASAVPPGVGLSSEPASPAPPLLQGSGSGVSGPECWAEPYPRVRYLAPDLGCTRSGPASASLGLHSPEVLQSGSSLELPVARGHPKARPPRGLSRSSHGDGCL